MRASGKDDAVQLTPAIKFTLKLALDFIDDDELVEITPKEIHLRKKHLTENDRKRAPRRASRTGCAPTCHLCHLCLGAADPQTRPLPRQLAQQFGE
jgi:hypothetical protein